MALVNTSAARGEFTKKVIGIFRDMAEPTLFFRSFFRTSTTEALQVAIEVERTGRQVAVDIARGTEGKITRSDKSSEKLYIPPFFDYKYNLQALDGYDRLFGMSDEIDSGHWARMVNRTASEVAKNVNRIQRRYELQCAQALLDGIVTMKNGDNIDFKRKTESLVDESGTPWTDNANHPGATLEKGAKFLVQQGFVSPGSTFNVIMGSDAWNAFRANTKRSAEGDIKDQKFQDLTSPINFGMGAVVMGRYSYGAYNFVIWGYEGYYDDPENNNTVTPYMDPKKVIILPNEQTFEFAHGGVPAMVNVGNEMIPSTMEGEFVAYRYNDMAKASAFFGVRSAALPILSFVDRVFTAQVIA